MNNTIRNIQLTAVLFVLLSTIIAFFLEVQEMYECCWNEEPIAEPRG